MTCHHFNNTADGGAQSSSAVGLSLLCAMAADVCSTPLTSWGFTPCPVSTTTSAGVCPAVPAGHVCTQPEGMCTVGYTCNKVYCTVSRFVLNTHTHVNLTACDWCQPEHEAVTGCNYTTTFRFIAHLHIMLMHHACSSSADQQAFHLLLSCITCADTEL